MSLDVNGITSGLVKIVKDLIPHRLSTSQGQSGPVPSVILNRTKAPKPAFPYAVVDHIGIQKVGYAERDNYLDDSDNEVTEFDYKLRCFVAIHAGTNQDTLGICEELLSRIMTSQGRRSFHTHLDSLNADLLSTSEISFLPRIMSTDFEEVARFTIDFWVRSVITDDQTGVIEQISTEGELYHDYDQTEPPIEINVNVP